MIEVYEEPRKEEVLYALRGYPYHIEEKTDIIELPASILLLVANYLVPSVGLMGFGSNISSGIYTLKLTKDRLYIIDDQKAIDFRTTESGISEIHFDEILKFNVIRENALEILDIYLKDSRITISHNDENFKSIGEKIKHYIMINSYTKDVI